MCAHACRPEKNWAFFEHQGRLQFLYSLLPCTLAFAYDPASPKGAVLTHAYCYTDPDQVLPLPDVESSSSVYRRTRDQEGQLSQT